MCSYSDKSSSVWFLRFPS
uniref:Uncharacterized protein n=1 Tax=Arundo donax TaxID=35708 RepID=A0A0A8YW72_ARUDO